MKIPRVLILRTAGTNCDKETAFAFDISGAKSELSHINELTADPDRLKSYHILALPGGFTYGDDIASGKILANELRFKLGGVLKEFVNEGKLIIGICNGFQILVKAGILPNLSGNFCDIDATLTLNDSNRFEDRWIYLKKTNSRADRCIWTKNIDGVINLPVAHGEGKFIPRNATVLNKLKDSGMIALTYTDELGRDAQYPGNPNGSVENIAGICDTTGRVFGLMPHPERHISAYQGPQWTRKQGNKKEGDGLAIFTNGVNFAKKCM